MKQSRFTQRELFDDVPNRARVCWPSFTELHQSGADLRRVQRCRRFLPGPISAASHHAGLRRWRWRQNPERFFLDLEINRTVAGQLAVKLQGNVLVARYAQALGLKILNFGNTDLRTEYNVLQVLYDFEEAEAFEYDDIKQPVI